MSVLQNNFKGRIWVIGLILVAAVLGVYGQTLDFDFVYWDDDIHVFNNAHLRSPSALPFFWRHRYEDLYIPVSYTAFFLLTKLARLPDQAQAVSATGALLNPHVFHAASLALHVLNTLLVLALLRTVVQSDTAAGAGAALFALHPVQVESVAWISELRGLLAATFGLSSLLWLIQNDPKSTRRWMISAFGATALFVLALLCKPSTVCLPLVAGALIWAQRRVQPSKGLWTTLAFWCVLSGAFVLVTRAAQRVPATVLVCWWQRPLVAGDALAFYLRKLVWFWPLGIDYGRTPGSVLHHPEIVLACLIPITWAVLAWDVRRRSPGLAAGTVLFGAALLPVLGLIPFGFQYYSTVADRYLYLAMLGPALALAWLLQRAPRLIWAVTGAALVIWGAASFLQARTWRDSFSLFSQAAAVNPHSLVAHTNLAVILLQRGEVEDALAQEEEAARLNPTDAKCWNDIGAILSAEGRYTEALGPLRNAIRLDQGNGAAYTNLSNAFSHLGRLEDATDAGRRAVASSPDYAAAHTTYGIALEAQGRLAEAIRQYRIALQIAPNSPMAQAHLQGDMARTSP